MPKIHGQIKNMTGATGDQVNPRVQKPCQECEQWKAGYLILADAIRQDLNSWQLKKELNRAERMRLKPSVDEPNDR